MNRVSIVLLAVSLAALGAAVYSVYMSNQAYELAEKTSWRAEDAREEAEKALKVAEDARDDAQRALREARSR